MKRIGSWLGLATFAWLALAPELARAEDPYGMAPPPSTRRLDARRDAPLARVSLGLRGQWYGSEGRDPFTNSDFGPQLSMGADVTLLRSRQLSLAVGATWDFGRVDGTARSVDTSLSTHRVLVPIEARWHWSRWIYGFLRAAPGFTASVASARGLESNVGNFSDTRYAFAADLSAGAAFALVPPPKNGKRGVRLWLVPELGYGLAGKTTFNLEPPDKRPDSDVRVPGTTLATRLPGYSPSGPFFRLSFALGF